MPINFTMNEKKKKQASLANTYISILHLLQYNIYLAEKRCTMLQIYSKIWYPKWWFYQIQNYVDLILFRHSMLTFSESVFWLFKKNLAHFEWNLKHCKAFSKYKNILLEAKWRTSESSYTIAQECGVVEHSKNLLWKK